MTVAPGVLSSGHQIDGFHLLARSNRFGRANAGRGLGGFEIAEPTRPRHLAYSQRVDLIEHGIDDQPLDVIKAEQGEGHIALASSGSGYHLLGCRTRCAGSCYRRRCHDAAVNFRNALDRQWRINPRSESDRYSSVLIVIHKRVVFPTATGESREPLMSGSGTAGARPSTRRQSARRQGDERRALLQPRWPAGHDAD